MGVKKEVDGEKKKAGLTLWNGDDCCEQDYLSNLWHHSRKGLMLWD